MTPHPVEVLAQDGCVLRGQVWPGESDWIILLHDAGPDEDLDRWLPLVPSLLAERLSVLAVDLRGHGASDGEWQDATAVGDAAAIVRFARERGAELVVMVAAGASAVDALRAVEHESVDGVVLLSATAPYPPGPLPPDRSRADRGGRRRRTRHWKCRSQQRKPAEADLTGPRLSRLQPTSVREHGTSSAVVGLLEPPDPGGKGETQGMRSLLPRASGIPKLFIVGAHDPAARETTADLRASSIGWALVVTFPTEQHGTDLLGGDWSGHVREQILGFVRECRYLARSGRMVKGAGG